MRAAQIDVNGYVINYVVVGGFDAQFINPLTSVIGSHWNGTAFTNPVPPVIPLPDASPIILASYNASLKRKAEKLQEQGKSFEAVQLLLQAQGVQS